MFFLKKSIIQRYVKDKFSNNYRVTIGVDFALKDIKWDNDKYVRLQLWDIAGQDRFTLVTRAYYKEACGAIIVFNPLRTETFESVLKWKVIGCVFISIKRNNLDIFSTERHRLENRRTNSDSFDC